MHLIQHVSPFTLKTPYIYSLHMYIYIYIYVLKYYGKLTNRNAITLIVLLAHQKTVIGQRLANTNQ